MNFYGTLLIMCACTQNRATVKMLKSLIIVRAFEVEQPEPEAKFFSQMEGNDNGGVVTRSGENTVPERVLLGRFTYQSEDAPDRTCKQQLCLCWKEVFNTIQLSWFQERDPRTCLAESPDTKDRQTEWVSSLFEKVEGVSFLVKVTSQWRGIA